jgi:hypothetical protein
LLAVTQLLWELVSESFHDLLDQVHQAVLLPGKVVVERAEQSLAKVLEVAQLEVHLATLFVFVAEKAGL